MSLDYTFQLPDAAPFPVPLAVPHLISRGQARVRVWSDSGNLPASSPGWTEQNIEEVPGRNRLPVLVLGATRPDAPLTLRSGPGAAPFTVLIERALVCASRSARAACRRIASVTA